MSTATLPAAEMRRFEEELGADRFCHLFLPGAGRSICGAAAANLDHPQLLYVGDAVCPGCGRTVCPDCVDGD